MLRPTGKQPFQNQENPHHHLPAKTPSRQPVAGPSKLGQPPQTIARTAGPQGRGVLGSKDHNATQTGKQPGGANDVPSKPAPVPVQQQPLHLRTPSPGLRHFNSFSLALSPEEEELLASPQRDDEPDIELNDREVEYAGLSATLLPEEPYHSEFDPFTALGPGIGKRLRSLPTSQTVDYELYEREDEEERRLQMLRGVELVPHDIVNDKKAAQDEPSAIFPLPVAKATKPAPASAPVPQKYKLASSIRTRPPPSTSASRLLNPLKTTVAMTAATPVGRKPLSSSIGLRASSAKPRALSAGTRPAPSPATSGRGLEMNSLPRRPLATASMAASSTTNRKPGHSFQRPFFSITESDERATKKSSNASLSSVSVQSSSPSLRRDPEAELGIFGVVGEGPDELIIFGEDSMEKEEFRFEL